MLEELYQIVEEEEGHASNMRFFWLILGIPIVMFLLFRGGYTKGYTDASYKEIPLALEKPPTLEAKARPFDAVVERIIAEGDKRTQAVTEGIIIQLDNEAGRRYGIHSHEVDDTQSKVEVYDRRSRGALWAQKVQDVTYGRWSPDRRALVLVDREPPTREGKRRFTFWRVGEKPVNVVLPHFNNYLLSKDALRNFDIFQDALWSPDNERLIIRGSWSMGDADDGISDLWCIRYKPYRVRFISSHVTWAEWISPTRIRYTAESLNLLGSSQVRERDYEVECR